MTMIPPQPPSPPARPNDRLDDLLASHLAAALEPQRGRALAAFRRHTSAGASPTTSRPSSRQVVAPAEVVRRIDSLAMSRRALWLWAGVPSLLAASLALVLTLQFLKPPSPHGELIKPIAGNNNSLPASEAPSLDQVELSRDVDGGITWLNDNTPVRLIRHQTLRQLQWVDPQDKATYSVTEPIENVGYVQIQTN